MAAADIKEKFTAFYAGINHLQNLINPDQKCGSSSPPADPSPARPGTGAPPEAAAPPSASSAPTEVGKSVEAKALRSLTPGCPSAPASKKKGILPPPQGLPRQLGKTSTGTEQSQPVDTRREDPEREREPEGKGESKRKYEATPLEHGPTGRTKRRKVPDDSGSDTECSDQDICELNVFAGQLNCVKSDSESEEGGFLCLRH